MNCNLHGFVKHKLSIPFSEFKGITTQYYSNNIFTGEMARLLFKVAVPFCVPSNYD